jgi:hypothetical protein
MGLVKTYENIDNENSEKIEKLGGYIERALAYDGVWVIAHSLNQTLNQYQNSQEQNIITHFLFLF